MPEQLTLTKANALTNRIIGACIEVHKAIGPGLLESAYEACLCHELALNGVAFEQQRPLRVSYKGLQLESAYRLDLVVEGLVIVELKAVEVLLPIHQAQLLTYLKLTELNIGLLVNFNTPVLTQGVKRVVNRLQGDGQS
jgi:GxxExxY protein